jgi:hypothetical protein
LEKVRFLLRSREGVDESRRHIEFRLEASRVGRRPIRAVRSAHRQTAIGAVGVGAPQGFATCRRGVGVTRLLRAALVDDDTFTLSAEAEEAWRIVNLCFRRGRESDGPC